MVGCRCTTKTSIVNEVTYYSWISIYIIGMGNPVVYPYLRYITRLNYGFSKSTDEGSLNGKFSQRIVRFCLLIVSWQFIPWSKFQHFSAMLHLRQRYRLWWYSYSLASMTNDTCLCNWNLPRNLLKGGLIFYFPVIRYFLEGSPKNRSVGRNR